MKKIMAVATIILCLAVSSPSFARGHGGHHGGHHGLGIALGVAGGLLLGSALLYSAPPPPTVVYQSAYPVYPPEVVVRQPVSCMEDRLVEGEWQIRKDGRQVWVPYSYPITRRIEVPCP